MRIFLAAGMTVAVCALVQCTPRKFNDTEVKSFEDVQKVELDQWGTYTVTCRNGNTESKVSKEQIQANQVCKTASTAAFLGKTFCRQLEQTRGNFCLTFLENGTGQEITGGDYPRVSNFRWQIKPNSTAVTPVIAIECPKAATYNDVYREAVVQNEATKLRVSGFYKGNPTSEVAQYDASPAIKITPELTKVDCFAK